MWDYAQGERTAVDYDEHLADNHLTALDDAVLLRCLTRPGLVVDLGAGTGRSLIPLAHRGFQAIAVDLSLPMLQLIGRKAAAEGLAIDRLLANIAELDCLRDGVADYCISLFSTLGMVRGRANRRRVLAHVRRVSSSRAACLSSMSTTAGIICFCPKGEVG